MRPDRNALFERAWALMTPEQRVVLQDEATDYFESVRPESTVFLLGPRRLHEDEFLYKQPFQVGQPVFFYARRYVVVRETRESGQDHSTVTVDLREATVGDAW